MTLARLAGLLALVIGLSPAPILAQNAPASLLDKVQPIRVTVPLPAGDAATAASEKVRQAALKSGANITPEKAQAAVSNRTVMTFSPDGVRPPVKRYDVNRKLISETPAQPYQGHGTQLEYIGADGRTFLWYPGNTGMVVGEWKLNTHPFKVVIDAGSASFDLVDLCFRYLTPSVNPVTGSSGSNWSCTPTYMYLQRIVESATDDPFGLSRRPSPPFVLERDRTTIDALRKKAGG
jgi:hypothetical protein